MRHNPDRGIMMSALLAVQWGTPHPMFAGKRAPSPATISFFMALILRFKRFFRRQPKGQTA
jgi:hypothetical protein